MARLRYNNALGTLGGSLTDNGTTITFALAPAFATIVAPDYIPLVLEPPAGLPSANFEIVYLTAYTAGATTGTILRAREGTAGVTHSNGVTWVHGASVADLGAACTNLAWSPGGVALETYSRKGGRVAEDMGLASGQIHEYGGCVIPAGFTVTNVTFVSRATPANSPTHQWFAILDQSYNVLALTADDLTTAWAANTRKTLGLSAPWTPTVDTPVYLAICVVAGATPTLDGIPMDAASSAIAPAMCTKSNAPLTTPGSLSSPATAGLATVAGVAYAYAS